MESTFRMDPLYVGLNCKGFLQSVNTYIRLGWKRLTVASTVAYYDTLVKHFIVQVTCHI